MRTGKLASLEHIRLTNRTKIVIVGIQLSDLVEFTVYVEADINDDMEVCNNHATIHGFMKCWLDADFLF